jgi:predicted thioesterase
MSEAGQQFPIGASAENTQVVSVEVTAKHMGSGAVQVFATPSMVRLMEMTAVKAVAPYLEAGQQTVGVWVNIRHLAASPLGLTITAHAELTQVDGRRLTFRVTCHDGIELVGEGIHERALIDLERFEARVERKRAQVEAGKSAS